LRLLVATRSRHKVGEIRSILSDVPDLELIDLDQAGIAESPAEDELEPYETFEENARSKASYFQRVSGLPTVADDSGMVVDALGGQPGVRSRRFAPLPAGAGREEQDQANNRHLIDLLADVPPERRTARYVCVAALVEPGGREAVFRGSVEGVVVDRPKGEGGFGYDPYFVVPELGRTFAEAASEEKHALSHRGKAFRALAAHLRTRGTR
jgi:XTP/dITP diphosphohydrolase